MLPKKYSSRIRNKCYQDLSQINPYSLEAICFLVQRLGLTQRKSIFSGLEISSLAAKVLPSAVGLRGPSAC